MTFDLKALASLRRPTSTPTPTITYKPSAPLLTSRKPWKSGADVLATWRRFGFEPPTEQRLANTISRLRSLK